MLLKSPTRQRLCRPIPGAEGAWSKGGLGKQKQKNKTRKGSVRERATSFLCCQAHAAFTCGFNACVDSALWGYKRGFHIPVLQI